MFFNLLPTQYTQDENFPSASFVSLQLKQEMPASNGAWLYLVLKLGRTKNM
jgi:hypothetical protein